LRQAAGGGMQNVNKRGVFLAVWKVFPPMCHEDGETVAVDASLDFRQNLLGPPKMREMTARMGQQGDAPDPPMRSAADFLEGITRQPGLGQPPPLKPAGGNDAKAFGDRAQTLL